MIAFAMSGLLAAARKRLDVVGVFVVAGLTAFGGGTLRDILLDRRLVGVNYLGRSASIILAGGSGE